MVTVLRTENIDTCNQFIAWQNDNETELAVAFGLLRHVAFCFANLACATNIERWTALVTQNTRLHSGSTDSFINNDRQILNQRFNILKVALILFSVFWSCLQMSTVMSLTALDTLFYFYQGVLVQPLFVVGYFVTYRRVKAYHYELLRTDENLLV